MQHLQRRVRASRTGAEGIGVYGTLWYDSFATTGGYERVFNLSTAVTAAAAARCTTSATAVITS